MKKLVAIGAMTLLLAACNTTGGTKEIGGTLIGGGLGALAGTQIGSGKGQLAATAVGTLLGAYLGREAGVSLDRADKAYAASQGQAAYPPPRFDSGAYTGGTGTIGGAVPTTRVIGTRCERLDSGALACQGADGTWSLYR